MFPQLCWKLLKMATYTRQDVVAVACALYRINGNQIIKDGAKDQIPSKLLMAEHFAGKVIVDVTDADREYADVCVAQLQHRQLMNQLTDRQQSDFIDDITAMTHRDTIPSNKFGIAVWIPKVVAGMQAEEQQKLDISHLAFTSKFQGKVGEKLTVEFHPIRVKFVHEYGCYRHFGHDGNGNLIGFLNKKSLTGKVCGKIKSQETSKYNNNGKVTYLNYVKEVE